MKERKDGAQNINTTFENRMLRRISGPKWSQKISWRKLHNKKLYNSYPPLNIIRIMK
jgi:hypothetical protein